MPIVDLKLTQNSNGVFDFTVVNKNFAKHSGMDTSLQVSLLTDARATAAQVASPEHRRGFLGDTVNRIAGRKLGSWIWLVNQRRLTQDTVNLIVDYAGKAFQWLIDDGLAVNVQVSGAIIPTLGIELKVVTTAIDGQTETRFFKLWELTGV